MWKTLLGGLAAAVGAVGIATASPASAGTSDYLRRLQEEVPYILDQYGSQALISEGYKVCGWAGQGMDSLEIIRKVQADMPMSFNAANKVTVLAESRLGC
jgi:hypothetical protein